MARNVLDKKDIIKWNEILTDWQKSTLTKNDYCKQNKLNIVKFKRRYSWILEMKDNPGLIEKYLPYIEEHERSGLNIKKFTKLKGISEYNFTNVKNHIQCMEFLKEESNNKMSFIQVPAFSASALKPVDQVQEIKSIIEINKPPIEISFNHDIKVTLPNNIHTEKLVKIIELLKDL